jgi:hypothetical protein
MNVITGQLIDISQSNGHTNLSTEPLTTFFDALVNTCDTEKYTECRNRMDSFTSEQILIFKCYLTFSSTYDNSVK